MRFKITGDWKDGFYHDGLLYCVQRIEEMLMVYTSHLYKVPVYNSFLLAYEFLAVYNTVEKKSIDQAHLKNILEEFIDTFESDIVIKEHFTDEQIRYFKGRLTGSSISDQRRTMNYLIHVMGNYPQWCENTLRKAIEAPKEKKKIEKALRSYVPMIIGIGYKPHFIYSRCQKVFTEKEIQDLSPFEDFVATFTRVENDYTVYFPVNKTVEKFKSIFEERLNLSFDQDHFSEKLGYDSKKQICVHISVSELDPEAAARRAYLNFDLFMRYYRFLGNRDQEWIGKKCLVKDNNDNYTFSHIGSVQHFYSQDYDDKTLGKNSERIITQLLENAGRNDFFMIDKVIRTHNTALSNSDINNAFLNLWSVMEIVGVDGFSGDVSKNKQILNNIVPILKRNYVNRVIEELHDYLKGNLDQKEYASLIEKISEEGPEEFKIACLVALNKYDDVRTMAYTMLHHYPLIRSRISQLHEDVFKKKKKFIAELNRYEQRIIWHIQRLYRTRNSIIHSGEIDENIVFLVEHLHSYVDELILDIIDRMTQPQSLGTVSNVMLDAQVFIENLNKEWAKDEELTSEDIRKLLK